MGLLGASVAHAKPIPAVEPFYNTCRTVQSQELAERTAVRPKLVKFSVFPLYSTDPTIRLSFG